MISMTKIIKKDTATSEKRKIFAYFPATSLPHSSQPTLLPVQEEGWMPVYHVGKTLHLDTFDKLLGDKVKEVDGMQKLN